MLFCLKISFVQNHESFFNSTSFLGLRRKTWTTTSFFNFRQVNTTFLPNFLLHTRKTMLLKGKAILRSEKRKRKERKWKEYQWTVSYASDGRPFNKTRGSSSIIIFNTWFLHYIFFLPSYSHNYSHISYHIIWYDFMN